MGGTVSSSSPLGSWKVPLLLSRTGKTGRGYLTDPSVQSLGLLFLFVLPIRPGGRVRGTGWEGVCVRVKFVFPGLTVEKGFVDIDLKEKVGQSKEV